MGLFKGMKDAMGDAKSMQEQAMAAMGSTGGMQVGEMPAGTAQDAATLNATGAEMRRLWAEGLDGDATIRDFTDTGERLAGNTVLDLDLIVTVAGGEPYATTLRMTIAGGDTSAYLPGSQYAVKVDPVDRTNLTFAPAS